MELIKHTLPKNAEIVMTSDWHEGAAQQHQQGIQAVIAYVMAKPNRYMIHGGDIVEAIAVDDKRYQADSVDPDKSVTLAQYHGIIDKLRPVAKAKKLLGIHEGNHDARWLKVGNFVKNEVCKALGVPFGTYTAKYIISGKDNKVKYKIFVTHGNGSIAHKAQDPVQREANMKVRLKTKLKFLAADCAVMAMGHTHKLLVVDPVHELCLTDDGVSVKQSYVINPGNTRIIHADHRWYLNTGSFMKLYGKNGTSGYAEKAMYDPVELGYCVIETDDHKVINCRKVVV